MAVAREDQAPGLHGVAADPKGADVTYPEIRLAALTHVAAMTDLDGDGSHARMHGSTRKLALVAIALSLLGTPLAHAQGPMIRATGTVSAPSVSPGALQDVSCTIDNLSNESIQIQMSAIVTYADGRDQALLRGGAPMPLEPGMSVGVFILFVVPSDAAFGTALYECGARAIGSGWMETASHLSTFEVVPA